MTTENVENVQSRAQPDRTFNLANASPQVGSKNEFLTQNATSDPFSFFTTMFDSILSKITKDTNVRILNYNNLRFCDAKFVSFVNRTEIIRYFGLVLILQLRKTDSIITREFIRNEFNQKSVHLYSRINRTMEQVDSF